MTFREILQKNVGFKVALISTTLLLGLFAGSFVLFSQMSLFEGHDDFLRFTALLAIFFLLLQFTLTMVFTNLFITRPLSRFKETMNQVKQGNLEVQPVKDSQDEIGELEEGFHQMIENLKTINERRKNIEKKLVKTEESLRYKTELESKSKIIERMNKELTQSFNNVALLYTVSQYLNSVIDVGELINTVQEIFEQKFVCHQYALYFLTDSNSLRLSSFKGFPQHSQWNDHSLEIGKGVVGVVAEQKRALYIDDLTQAEIKRAGLENEMRGSLFSVPLLVRNRLIGVLTVVRAAQKAFTPSDRQSVESIATQIANAHDRCMLYTQTKELSVRDELTGLYNRRHFQQMLEREFKRSERYKREMSLLMIDVDHFKQYNDTFGHLKGDVTLKAIAQLLSTNVREVDVLARYGGEEFVLLLPNTELKNAIKVAEKLRAKVQDQFHGDITPIDSEKSRPVTISIGVAAYPNIQSLGELVHAADMALYRAKREGRNRVVAQAVETQPEYAQAQTKAN